MPPLWERLLTVSSVGGSIVSGLVGAYASRYMKPGGPRWALPLYLAAALLGTLLWIGAVRLTTGSLARVALIWDALYTVGYFAMFIVLGEKLAGMQWLGAGLIITGMLLLR